MITRDDLKEALRILHAMWPKRIDDLMKTAAKDPDLFQVWVDMFSSWSPEQLVYAARKMHISCKRMFESDNPINMLAQSLGDTQGQGRGDASPSVARAWGLNEKGKVVRITPQSLERYRPRATEYDKAGAYIGKLTYENIGVLYECSKIWADAEYCSDLEKATAKEALDEWLRDLFANAYRKHTSDAAKKRSEQDPSAYKRNKAYLTTDKSAKKISDVLGGIGDKGSMVRAANMRERRRYPDE